MSFDAEPMRKLMLLNAFNISPRSSRLVFSENLILLTMLKSERKNAGPLRTRLLKPHWPANPCKQSSPGRCDVPTGRRSLIVDWTSGA